MKSFSTLKSKCQKYQEQIDSLQEAIKKEKETLRKEIVEYWYQTKFMTIKLDNGGREYYYLSSFDLLDLNSFYGVRLSKTGKVDFGKISFEPLLLAMEYETIEADRFFSKLKSFGICLEDYQTPIVNELNCFKPVVNHCYNDKKKIVGYCRLSQDSNNKNKFDRQVSLITKFVEKSDDYHLVEIFSEIVQGDTKAKDRQIFSDLIEYCTCNDVHSVVVSELNRLGRTQEVILSIISYLNKNDVNEIYVLKENILINEEYITNNYRRLRSMAKECEDEYENIKYRMREGYKAYVEKRNDSIKNGDNDIPKLGRQGYVKSKDSYLRQYGKEIDMLFNTKFSRRQIKTITGTSLGTLQKLYEMFKNDYISIND
jgi:DNA invertase Pin-like site-specific DNA recombinase